MISETDWRAAAVVLANANTMLADMVRKAYPDQPEVLENLKVFDDRCAQILTTAAIEGAKK